jgi:multicomponent Na+:H+ antiporter subunit E
LNQTGDSILWRAVLLRAGLLAGLWAVLTGGAPSSWIIGAPVVLAGALVCRVLPVPPSSRWTVGGTLRFSIFFIAQSLWSGVDVARRAFDPRRPWAPRLITYSFTQLTGPSRVFFANAVSLLPGTLSADLREDTLLVHALDHRQPVVDELRILEGRVAVLFGVEPPEEARQ